MVHALVLSLVVLAATPAAGEGVFAESKKAYAELRADKARKQQRVPYEKLIQKLTAAARQKSDKAEECAYFAATVAEDLSQASGLAADLEQAIKLNVSMAEQFPRSSLADDALLRAARMLAARKGDLEGARALLQRARKDHPKGDQARAVTELLARLPEPPAEKPAPRREKAPERVARAEPAAPRTHVDKSEKPAAMEEDTASRARLHDILEKFAEGARDAGTRAADAPAADKPAESDAAEAPDEPQPIRAVRLAAKGPRTEVALDVAAAVTLATGVAPAGKNVPARFYVDIRPALAGAAHKVLKAHKDARVLAARAAQFDANTVRVVFELKPGVPGAAAYDAGNRRVLITLGTPAERPQLLASAAPGVEPPPPPPPADPTESARADDTPAPPVTLELVAHPGVPDAGKGDAAPTLDDVKTLAKEFDERPSLSISAQTGLKVRRVVIDAGHGGEDPGAIGPSGVREKDVTLRIARKVAERLRKDLKMEVILTRDKDVFIPLEERTLIANRAHADLFISIHCNSNPNRRIYGVETYYLNITDDNYAIRLAARENKTSERSISDLQFILADLAMKSNVDDSVRLSKLVQANVVGELRENYGQVKDLGVKHALFYVLIGAKMPAILLESSFVSNKMEEQRLGSPKYQDRLADGIVQGVRNFVEERQALAR
ncbi:MAG: N-acetylmuramoyl-L-alanine amidase [Deltaproteobacteria bacterium]|nr:N-acetylmuramoyl-L-alanine amidase [Deltaproteobacteria bacterium]